MEKKSYLIISVLAAMYFVIGVGIHFYAVSHNSLIGLLPVLPNLMFTGTMGIYSGVNTSQASWAIFFFVNLFINTGLLILIPYIFVKIRNKNKQNASTH